MRLILTSLALIAALALAGCAGDSDETADAIKVGAEMTLTEATALADLVADPAAFVGKTIRIEGTVEGICRGSGCWMLLDDGQGNQFYAKSLDHSVGFPTDCMGKKAVVEGPIIVDAAAAAHEHEEGEEGHACPEPTYLLDMRGGLVL